VINLPNFDAALLEAIKTLPGDQVTTPLFTLLHLGFLHMYFGQGQDLIASVYEMYCSSKIVVT
jgi:hypothetical protein